MSNNKITDLSRAIQRRSKTSIYRIARTTSVNKIQNYNDNYDNKFKCDFIKHTHHQL